MSCARSTDQTFGFPPTFSLLLVMVARKKMPPTGRCLRLLKNVLPSNPLARHASPIGTKHHVSGVSGRCIPLSNDGISNAGEEGKRDPGSDDGIGRQEMSAGLFRPVDAT